MTLMIILDTNVISAVMRFVPEPRVHRWNCRRKKWDVSDTE